MPEAPAPAATRTKSPTEARDALAQVNNAARGDQRKAQAALVTATRQMEPLPAWRRWLTPVLGFLVIAALSALGIWAFWRRQIGSSKKAQEKRAPKA